MVPVSVVGVRGYAGGELVRLLLAHPEVQIHGLYGREPGEAGPAGEILPHLTDLALPVRALDDLYDDAAQFVFLSVPAEAAQQIAPSLIARGRRVIDLSGGHRLPVAM